ncbi:DUF4357 domain-containing protein [Bifidobacterium callitrichidarum]|uniref:DUF4357 domain-containing protein n=2 Tax=Bifidobacterium callitrichidarum TaxID=2052941 RepID=A0A2U2N895_9BIFI|nr:DUF4357 domain-containing protein [Bifidobacterium callitrichidarum]
MTMRLIDNDPDGIRICWVEGESLVTIVVPRDKLTEAKQLPDMPERGVYYLLDEDHGVLSRVYAGQTTQGLARLEAHKAKKEFWNKAVMFLDSDINIDRDVLDVLEAKTIDFVRRNGSYETDNTYLPSPHVNPYKEQRVEELHKSILFRMKVLGYDLNRLESIVHVSEGFHTKKNGIAATGKYDKETGRFTVFAGSDVDLGHGIIKNLRAIAAREHLFKGRTGKAKLDRDITFASPSTAAVFVLGGSQNGWTEWVDDQGKTLDEVYRNKEHMNE